MPDSFLPPRLRSRARGSSRFSIAPPPAPVVQDDDGDGFLGLGFGPDVNLGLGRTFEEIGGGISGLVRLALPGSKEGEPGWADAGKGMATSVLGTLATAVNTAPVLGQLDTLTGNHVENAVEGISERLFGEDYRAQDIFERIGERGILPALVEDIGNASLVAGAATAPVKGASIAARTAGATETAARLAGLHSRMLANPVIHALQHPYLSAGAKVRERVLLPATERYLSAHGVELADAVDMHTAPDGIDLDDLGDPGDLLVEAPEVTAPTAPPSRTTQLLSRLNEHLMAAEGRKVARDETRIAEAERAISARSPAVRQSVVIAREHLIEAAKAQGKRITRRQATDMVGDELFARSSAIKALETEFADLGPETFKRLGIRQSIIPDDLRTPELEAALDAAGASWVDEATKVRETLLQSRQGVRGLEGLGADDAMVPALTKRHERMLKQADRKLQRARSEVLERKITRERLRAEGKITAGEDRLARLGEDIQKAIDDGTRAVEAFDHSRRLVPKAFKTPETLLAAAEAIVQATIESGMGATFDPHTGRFLISGQDSGLAVGLVPETAKKVPVAELTAQDIVDVVSAYQDIYQHPGTTLGTWIEDGIVHIDPGEVISDLDDALIRGSARMQEAIWDLGNDKPWDSPLKDRPDIAQHFLTRNKGLKRLSRQLREVSESADFTPEDANLMIAEQARMAVRQWELGHIKHPDDFFGGVLKKYEFAKRRSTMAALGQIVLDRNILTPEAARQVWSEVEARVQDLDHALAWYHRSHDTIERLFRKRRPITLLDGKTKINPADLLYQLIAVTSVQAAPRDNLAHAFRAITRLGDIDQSSFDAAVRALQDVLAERKTLEEAFATDTKKARESATKPVRQRQVALGEQLSKDITESSQVPISRQYIMEILSGHTMDKWTPESISKANDDFGRMSAPDRDKALAFIRENTPETLERIGEEQAVREYWGRAGRAKLLSFWENLARPSDSLSVTMDMWMERLFGFEFELGGGGSWLQWADAVRNMASELSETLGRKVMPHEVQGALWVFAKTETTRIQVGHFLGYADEAAQAVRAGVPITDAMDPILSWLDESAEPYLQSEPRFEQKLRLAGQDEPEAVNFVPGGKGARGQQLHLIDKRRMKWLATRSEINAFLAVGDVDTALRHLAEFRSDMTTKAPRSLGLLDDVGGGDFADIWTNPDYHSKGFREAAEGLKRRFKDVQLGVLPGESLLQSFREKVLGEFVPLDDATKGIIRIFESGNFQTLVHENGHLLNQLLDGAQTRVVEQVYGIKNHEWTTKHMERFANDFVAWHMGASAPPGMEGVFARVREAIRDVWDMVRGTFHNRRVHPEIAAIFEDMLTPEVRPMEEGIDGLPPIQETGTLRQRAARVPGLPEPPAGKKEFYESGRRGAQALANLEKSAAKRKMLEATKAQVQKSIDDLRSVLDGHGLPSELERARLTEEAAKIGAKVREELGVPSVTRTPARWQPLWDAVLKLGKEAETNPELAGLLADLPRTLQEVQALAERHGFDPVHVRDFTPEQVRRLVFGNMRLGLGREGLLHEVQAGTRKTRTGILARRGAVDRSVEALLAATVEATNEVRTNAVIDWVEGTAARRLPRDAKIPDGWQLWDPVRTYLLTGTELSEDAMRTFQTAADDSLIIPNTVARTLDRFTKDYDHWAYRSIRKVTSPWRTLVLVLSPGWYVRNFVGNVMMASAEGVGLRDWVAAWKEARKTDEFGRFAELPFVRSGGLAHEAGELTDNTIIPRAGLREAVSEDGVRGALNEARRRAMRVNEVVDEFARAAVYHRSLNTLNMSPEAAWKRASEALVDYNALSPFERSAVRAVLPFYAWQKGILKVTLHQALDHPARISLLMQLGKINEEYIADRFGVEPEDVPGYYKHLIGDVNFRSFNPFSDPSELLTPEGVVRSMNPFLETSLRKGLGAPEFFPEQYRLGFFGTPEADVNVPSEILSLGTGSPAGRMLGGDVSGPQYIGLGSVDSDALRSRFLRARQQLRGIPNPETGTETQSFLPPRLTRTG